MTSTPVPPPEAERYDPRPLRRDELDAAVALWRDTEHLAPIDPDEIADLLAHSPDLVLAVDGPDGALVGVVLGGFDGRRGWISRLAVAPPARRSGLASRLVGALEAQLAARGCRQVNLLLLADNDVGRRFWQARGYTLSDDVALGSRRLDGQGAAGC